MDADRFDRLLRILSQTPSRRGALRLLAGSGLVGIISRGIAPAAAKKKNKKFALCHAGQTLAVSKKAKKKHLRQGATLGACQTSPPPPASPPPPPGCASSCAGKVCGDDGCGGACGNPCPAGETCVDGGCVCLPEMEVCDSACVAPCSGNGLRNPETCGCCAPHNSTQCVLGPSTACCSGICVDAESVNFCQGRSEGEPCDFAAQCTSNVCNPIGFCG